MIALQDYAGREQSYVKHVFLERYLEALILQDGEHYNHIVYVDGFAGPWQSANEHFEDTSFGIALNALSQAKADVEEEWPRRADDGATWSSRTERPCAARDRSSRNIPTSRSRPTRRIFSAVVPDILKDIPPDAFTFFLIDPEGLAHPACEPATVARAAEVGSDFNFMFEFINRAASMSEPVTVAGLNELMPHGDWRTRLAEAERARDDR